MLTRCDYDRTSQHPRSCRDGGRRAGVLTGHVYQRPGAFRNADSIRIMEPTSKYPSGYVRYYNSGNQPLDVFGNPGADPFTHIPQDYVGPWPGWPR